MTRRRHRFRLKQSILLALFFSTATMGQTNYSLSFDGVDDYVIMGDPNGLDVGNTDFTIKVVFKIDPDALESGKAHQLVSKRGVSYGNGFELLVGNQGMLQATLYDNSSETPFYATSDLGEGNELPLPPHLRPRARLGHI